MLRRYTASADTTIVNAWPMDELTTRATGSNTGRADVMEIFSVYGRYTTSSQELSRALIKFPIDQISSERTSGTVPASGSVSFYLRLYNAPIARTNPRDYRLVIQPMFTAWQEGDGLDLYSYEDITNGNPGANWMSASATTGWNSVSGGGDWLSSSADYRYESYFDRGTENIEVDITPLVERWIKGASGGGIANYGLGIKLSASYEAYATGGVGTDQSVQKNPKGATKSYYTKRFFSRGSQYWFMRPTIEARWDDVERDDRGNFFFSSSRAPAADNLNTIYFYNYIRGRLVNLPDVGTGTLLVSLYSGSTYDTHPNTTKLTLYDGQTSMTGGWIATGVYTCSIGIVSSSTKTLYDVWHTGGTQYYTGSILPQLFGGGNTNAIPSYILNISNLKDRYFSNETARMTLYVREKYWSPTIYTRATAPAAVSSVVSASYRVYRVLDGYSAIDYGTGSDFHTGLSYDVSGNYFDLDMRLLQPGYAYGLKFAFYDARLKSWEEQDQVFKFRVEDYEY